MYRYLHANRKIEDFEKKKKKKELQFDICIRSSIIKIIQLKKVHFSLYIYKIFSPKFS